MNKLKAFYKKYGLERKQLSILLGYSEDNIYRLESGKRQITKHFEISLKNLEILLKIGAIKIPK
jgi:DNA-binding XRE family transcriptional regulator